MAELNSWDITASNNNSAPPDGWPENTMQYSEVNDTAREGMAVLARWFKDNNGSLTLAGTANARTVTLNAGYTAYFVGMTFKAQSNLANTGATTINVNAIGAVSVTDREGNPLNSGDLKVGAIYEFIYDGTNFQLLSGLTANDNETITGNWTFIGNNTFSGNNTFTASGAKVATAAILLNSTVPAVMWQEVGASVDSGIWRAYADGDSFVMLGLWNDAETVTTQAVRVDRTGTVVDEIELNATLIDINGGVDITGNLQVNGGDAYLILNETNGGVNEKVWHQRAAANELWFGSATDAAPTTFANSWCRVQRSGTSFPQITFSATELQFDGTTVDINAALDVSGTLDVAGTATFTGGFDLNHASTPHIDFIEGDAGTDEKRWRAYASGGNLIIGTRTDADVSGNNAIIIYRSGTTVDEFEVNATTTDINGNVDVGGSLSVTNGTDAVTFSHNGVNALVGFTATSLWEIEMPTSGVDFLDSGSIVFYINNINNRVDIRDGWELRIHDSTDTDSAGFRHTGTDFWTQFTTTTDWVIFGLTGAVEILNTVRFFNTGGTDYLQFSHDGTNLLVTQVNTGEIRSNVPTNSLPAARTFSASTNTASTDYGLILRMTGGSGQTLTLDGDPPTNATVLIDNSSGFSWTIAASTTLIWANDGSTGSRTLGDDGMAVAVHRGGGVWVIGGNGLT